MSVAVQAVGEAGDLLEVEGAAVQAVVAAGVGISVVVDGHARAIHREDVVADPAQVLLDRGVIGGDRRRRDVELGAVRLGDQLVDLALAVRAGHQGRVVMVIVTRDHRGHLVGLHRSEELVLGGLLGGQGSKFRGAEFGGVHPIAIARVFARGRVHRHDVATEHVVLVVAAQDVLMGEDEGLGVGGAAGERVV